jgi:peptidoglycan/LPS O-acetylase OafA/YrhL
MSAGLRNPRIDLIRGIAILLVLFHHFNIAYTLRDTSLAHLVGWNAMRALARNGNYGVTIFFVVSGFLITSNADRRWNGLKKIDVSAFYVLRGARILPCVLLVLAIVNMLALSGVAAFPNHPELMLLPVYLTLSLALAELIRRFYAEPLNRRVRQHLLRLHHPFHHNSLPVEQT